MYSDLENAVRQYETVLARELLPHSTSVSKEGSPHSAIRKREIVWRPTATKYLESRPLYKKLAEESVRILAERYPEDRILIRGMTDPEDGKVRLWIDVQSVNKTDIIPQDRTTFEQALPPRALRAFTISRNVVSQ